MDPCCGLSLWAAQTAHPNWNWNWRSMELYTRRTSDVVGLCPRAHEKLWHVQMGCTEPTESENQWQNWLTQVYLENGN